MAAQPAATSSNFTGAVSAVGSAGSSKDQSVPPSGKSGKKSGIAAIIGSSSSRARNISHVTNKDSDKEPQTASVRETRKGKKSEQRAKEKSKRKNLLLKSETPSSHNVHPLKQRSSESTMLAKGASKNLTAQVIKEMPLNAPENNPNEPPNEFLEIDP